jgi:hypothetical protein
MAYERSNYGDVNNKSVTNVECFRFKRRMLRRTVGRLVVDGTKCKRHGKLKVTG